MDIIFLFFVIGYIVLSLILVPFQYRYVEQMEKIRQLNKKKGISQGQMFEDMDFEHQVLHANVQGNLLFLLANMIATILYKIKHRQ